MKVYAKLKELGPLGGVRGMPPTRSVNDYDYHCMSKPVVHLGFYQHLSAVHNVHMLRDIHHVLVIEPESVAGWRHLL